MSGWGDYNHILRGDKKQGGAGHPVISEELELLLMPIGCPDTPEQSTTPFSYRGKIHHLRSLWMECTGKYRPGCYAAKKCSPRLGYDAQSRRHNISDYTTVITGMATAHSNVVQAAVMLLLRKSFT